MKVTVIGCGDKPHYLYKDGDNAYQCPAHAEFKRELEVLSVYPKADICFCVAASIAADRYKLYLKNAGIPNTMEYGSLNTGVGEYECSVEQHLGGDLTVRFERRVKFALP